MHLPQEWSLLCRPVQSAYSKTERVEAAESVACRVFDTVPVARYEKREHEGGKQETKQDCGIFKTYFLSGVHVVKSEFW